MQTTEMKAIQSALRGHARDVAKLKTELRDLGGPTSQPDYRAIFMSAQILRHRIDMALLISRLSIRAIDKA
jgi:hypothetical protein